MTSRYGRCAVVLLLAGALHVDVADAADRKAEPAAGPSAAFGVGLGGGIGSVDDDGCEPGLDCDGTGTLFIGRVHLNIFAGPITFGGRYVGQLDEDGNASEVAGLIGIRPGRSPVSLMVGPGRIFDANDESQDEISVLSWEVLIAPHGRNVQFIVHGASGEADYIAFSFAASFGNQ